MLAALRNRLAVRRYNRAVRRIVMNPFQMYYAPVIFGPDRYQMQAVLFNASLQEYRSDMRRQLEEFRESMVRHLADYITKKIAETPAPAFSKTPCLPEKEALPHG